MITGKSGSGKTSYFQRLLENGFQSYWQTIFLFDWQGEMSERLRVESVTRIDDLPEALKTGFVCFDPGDEFEEDDFENGLLFFSKWSYEVCKASDEYPQYPRLFACDEIQLLMTPNSLPIEFQTIMQTGRRRGLDAAIVAQQLNELHNKIKSQSTERVTFQHEDPRVLQVMGDWGFESDVVSQLDVGEFLYLNDRGQRQRQRLFNGVSRETTENAVDTQGERA